MNYEIQFLKLLGLIAEQTETRLSDARVEFYRAALKEIGWERVCNGLVELLESAKYFPTVAEIKEVCHAGNPDLYGDPVMISDRIVQAMTQYGTRGNNATKIAELVGGVGVELISRMGGWQQLCDMVQSYDALTTHKAQWRLSAQAIINEWRAKNIDPVNFAIERAPDAGLIEGKVAEVVASFITPEDRDRLREKIAKLRAARKGQ